jgi:hypothetical protein
VRSLAQALGRDGPLGSHGPLGKLGPVADEPWSPSFWMNKVGDWSDLSKKLAEHGGPGSAAGPLGDRGPLGPALKNLDGPLLEELRAGGLFAPLGPLGPLGALGALGYLGLVGGHGYARNEDGNFVDKTGKVVRHASVLDASGKNKSFELVELFPEQSAKALRIHDASWAIRGAIGKDEADGDTFRFAAKKGQVITLTVVPESAGDTMTVELLQKGKVIARSESDKLVNWIHLEADRSGTLEVRVRKKEGASAPAPHPASMFIDAMLSPLVMWGEAVRPWVGAPSARAARAIGCTPPARRPRRASAAHLAACANRSRHARPTPHAADTRGLRHPQPTRAACATRSRHARPTPHDTKGICSGWSLARSARSAGSAWGGRAASAYSPTYSEPRCWPLRLK